MVKEKKLKAAAAVMSVFVLLSGTALAEKDDTQSELLFCDDFESYVSEADFEAVWNTEPTSTGDMSRNETSRYITNDGGRDCIMITDESAKAKDARLSVDIEVDEWQSDASAALYLCMDEYTDISAASGYRMVLDAAGNEVRAEKLSAGVTEILDQAEFNVSAEKKYNVSFSVKAGMLRGEINGAVWLMAMDRVPCDSGYAGFETVNQRAVLTNAVLSGESRLFYDNFESGRDFSAVDNGFITRKITGNSSTVDVSEGKLKLMAGADNKNEVVYYVTNEVFDESPAWKNTRVSIKLDVRSTSKDVYLRTGYSSSSPNPYVVFFHETTKYSDIIQNSSWATTKTEGPLVDETVADDVYSLIDIDLSSDEESEAERLIKCYLNGKPFMTGKSDVIKQGGISVTASKGREIWIDEVSISDSDSSTTTSDVIFNKNFSEYTEVGDVRGESVLINNGTSIVAEEGENGVLTLKNREFRNIDAAADVRTDGLKSGARAGMYVRYANEENNLFFGLDSRGVVLTETADGTVTDIASAVRTVSPGSVYRIRLEAKDGAYRGYIGDEMVINTTSDISGRRMSGSFGVGAVDADAVFDNIEINSENNDWEVVSENSGAALSFNPAYTVSDHNMLNAEMFITSFDPATQGAFQLTARLSGGKGYTAHIYVASESLKANIISPDWSSTFASNIDLGARISIGEYNRFGLETETLNDGNVKISIYVNDKLVYTMTDDNVKFTPQGGHNGYQVKTRYSEKNPIVPTRNVVLEDMNFDGAVYADIISDGNEAKVIINNRAFEVKKLNILTLAYSNTGRLTDISIKPISAASGEALTETVTVPSVLPGGRVKIICIDDFENMNLACDSVEIR